MTISTALKVAVLLAQRYGPNVINPFVVGGTGWSVLDTDGTHIVTFGAGTMRFQANTTTPVMTLNQANALTIGRTYRIVVPVLSKPGAGTLKSDGFSGTVFATAVGTQILTLVATATTFNLYRQNANVDVTLGDITIRELL